MLKHLCVCIGQDPKMWGLLKQKTNTAKDALVNMPFITDWNVAIRCWGDHAETAYVPVSV